MENQDEEGQPQITNLKLRLENKKNSQGLFNDLTNSSSNQQVGIAVLQRNDSIDLNVLLSCEKLDGRKPGQEIHLIKKPVVTEESKKIQERLNKYYQSKRSEENTQKAAASKAAKESRQFKQNQ